MGADDGRDDLPDIATTVRKIIADQLKVDLEEVKDDALFVENLGADSLDTLELIMDLEDEFEITITDEEAEKISTVGEAIASIERVANRHQDL